MAFRGYAAIVLLLYFFPGTAASQQYRTNLELIESIKDISLSSEIYSDAVNVKSSSVLFLSSVDGSTRDAAYNKFADSIEKFLNEFNTIFQHSRNGQPADREEGVKKAIDLKDEIVYLESLSRSSPELNATIVAEIVNKEKRSIDRFLDDQGKYFDETAEKEDAVPLRIEYMEYAERAYCASGGPECEPVKKKKEETRSNFNRDMEQARTISKKADEIMSGLEKDEKGLSELFSAYIASKNVISNYTSSLEIYHNNGISDKTLQRLPDDYSETYNELAAKKRDAEEISSSIFKRLITSLLKILTPLIFMLIVFMSGLREWKKDFADTKLNKIVSKV